MHEALMLHLNAFYPSNPSAHESVCIVCFYKETNLFEMTQSQFEDFFLLVILCHSQPAHSIQKHFNNIVRF